MPISSRDQTLLAGPSSCCATLYYEAFCYVWVETEHGESVRMVLAERTNSSTSRKMRSEKEKSEFGKLRELGELREFRELGELRENGNGNSNGNKKQSRQSAVSRRQ